MKTKINISNLKKMVVTIAAAMVLTTGTFASSTPANNEEMVSASRLEILMNATEQSIRFVAPAVEESQDVYFAIEELNALAVAKLQLGSASLGILLLGRRRGAANEKEENEKW